MKYKWYKLISKEIKNPDITKHFLWKDKNGNILLKYTNNIDLVPINLHIIGTSLEEITKPDDIVYSPDLPYLNKAYEILPGLYPSDRKVVASTDPTLGLPGISRAFLKIYAENHGNIGIVNLGSELLPDCNDAHNFGESLDNEHCQLKLDSLNCVCIEHYCSIDGKVMDERTIAGGHCLLGMSLVEDDDDSLLNKKSKYNPESIEDAAKKYLKDAKISEPVYKGQLEAQRINIFRAGAKWKEKQIEQEFLAFIKFIEKECSIRHGNLMHGLQSVPNKKDLYKIFKQS